MPFTELLSGVFYSRYIKKKGKKRHPGAGETKCLVSDLLGVLS